jgi:biotin carboxyl carrier protein
MALDQSHGHGQSQQSVRRTISDMIDQVNRFEGSPQEFLDSLLAEQCRFAHADAAAILHNGSQKTVDVLAVYPPLRKKDKLPSWLSRAIKLVPKVFKANAASVEPLPDSGDAVRSNGRRYLVIVPLKMVGSGLAAFQLATDDRAVLDARCKQLELTAGLLQLYETRLTLQKREADISRLHTAMETLSAVNRQDRFTRAAMAFCNEAASHWQCERVSLGFLEGRYIQLKAMSHTENFRRKMKLVQDIESAMEECLDQDIEILFPAPPEAAYVYRATGELCKRHGPSAIVSLPLRQQGQVRAVLTAEREADKPFDLDQVETLRLACELCSARLASLYERGRWIGARLFADSRRALAALVGPKYTWAKVAVILIFAALVFLVFGKGQYRAKASFALEATEQQLIPAPFDGYLKGVNVSVGDMIEGGKTALAELETAELRLQLAAAKAEKAGYLKQAAAAMRDADTAQAQIAQANADKAEAQIELLQYQIDQASMTSPISGVVVKGDLKREIGAPVKTGDVLFEVAPLESLRAELLMPEDQIVDISVGQAGYLATASYPSRRIKFIVERVNPAAELIKERNVFRVRARLQDVYPWMRPGMEGVAKVSVGKRSYAWIWTRRFVNWIRMKLWL